MTKWRYQLKRGRRWNTVTPAKVVKFIETNPGLTGAMIAVLWRRPYGTMSAVLHGLAKSGQIDRRMEVGMRGGKVKAWRYYESVAKQAVNAVINQTA